MKQQFTGSYTLDVASRTIVLSGIEIPPERLAVVINSTVGFVYHNIEHEPVAQVSVAPSSTGGLLSAAGYDAIGGFDGDYTLYQDGLDKGGVVNIVDGVIMVVNPGDGYSAGFANTVGGTRFVVTIDPSYNTVIIFPQYKDCEAHQNSDALSIFYDDGVDLGQLIKDESDETQALLQAEFDETQTAITDFRTEVKAEFDATQALLQTEFTDTRTAITDFRTEVKAESDETQTLLQTEFTGTRTALTDFRAEVKAESDATQALLQTEFDATQTLLTNFKTEVKAESDATQALLQSEFDATQTLLTAFKDEAKAESDETQTALGAKLPELVEGMVPFELLGEFASENDVDVTYVPGGYGPSSIVFSRDGVLLNAINLYYGTSGDSLGKIVLITSGSGRAWTFASGLTGTITGFRAVFTGAVNALLGAASTALTSNTSTNLNASASLTLSSPASVTSITCGTSSPKLGGTLDVSSFPNLTSITCAGNGITKFQGYGALTNLVDIILNDNEFNQAGFETLTNKPALRTLDFSASVTNQYINWTGAFPDLSGITTLVTLNINNSSLTGSNLNFSSLTNLTTLNIHHNRLSGAFPVFPTGANSKLTRIHIGQFSSNGVFAFTGTPPLLADHPSCTALIYYHNAATGSIQNLSVRPTLTVFACHGNLHTGDIPNLSANTSLVSFHCESQRGTAKITGFAGGTVSATLGDFAANGNQLTAAAVNAILAAFVAAGRTKGTRTIQLQGGSNAAPTGQGITDKATLQSRGWTVTTN